jgi:hypothetical protein
VCVGAGRAQKMGCCAWAWSLYATGVWDGDAVSVRVRGNPGGGGGSQSAYMQRGLGEAWMAATNTLSKMQGESNAERTT